ncbi:MAG TPA: hypothetical protein DFS52_29725 [Myxococcales bacterium]|jgi:Flp pilus assembly pilin Flp|nr:hypothetical protein [Myxococcales bacterium]
MKRLARISHEARRLLSDESGQAMVEYASVTTLLLGSVAAAGLFPQVVQQFFAMLQRYVDILFLALNCAIG